MRRAMCSIDLIVGCHDGPWLAVSNCNLERLEMDFPKCSFRNYLVDHEPSRFLVIRSVMFDTGPDPGILKRLDIRRRELACQKRVLAECLEVAASQRCPWNTN